MAVIVVRAKFSPAAKIVTYTGIEKQLEWLQLYGMRADGSSLTSPLPLSRLLARLCIRVGIFQARCWMMGSLRVSKLLKGLECPSCQHMALVEGARERVGSV